MFLSANKKKTGYVLSLSVTIISLCVVSFLSCTKDAQPVSLVNLREDLQIKGSISGFIRDGEGKPLNSVYVSVAGKKYATISQPTGFFSVPDVPAGTYTLTFKRFTYTDTALSDITIEINQDYDVEDTLVMRSSKARLSGSVSAGAAQTLSGAGITIVDQPYMTLSDDAGKFSFPELLAGDITVVAAKQGVGWGEVGISLAAGEQSTVSIPLLKQGGSVTGRVVDKNGDPLSGVAVSAVGGGVTDTTDENGHYVLKNLPSSVPIDIVAGEGYSISGLRVSEGGQLSGADLHAGTTVSAHGITLESRHLISAGYRPVTLSAEISRDDAGAFPLDSIAYFFWKLDSNDVIDTVTSSPNLTIVPSPLWGNEKIINYGVVTTTGDTLDGARITITRVSSIPSVKALASDTLLRTGEPCSFTGRTVSLDGSIVEYRWSFGDSSVWSRPDTSNVTHRYIQPGIYTAVFTALTEDSSDTDSITVTVSGTIDQRIALDSLRLPDIALDKPFDTDSLNYRATVPYETDKISFAAAALDSASMIVVNGDTLISGVPSDSIPLAVGENEIVIIVIAQDGTTGEYLIRIHRQENTDATLGSIALAGDSMNRTLVFENDSDSQRIVVSQETFSITISPHPSDSNARVIVNGDTIAFGDSVTVELVEGETSCSITVIAADNTTTRTYTATFVRPPVLENLTVTIGEQEVELGFRSRRYVYRLDVGYRTRSISVAAVVDRDRYRVIMDGDTLGERWGITRSLQVGANTVSVVIESLDKTLRTTYTLIVTRADAPLTGLYIIAQGDTLLSDFHGDSLTYSVVVPNTSSSVTLTPQTADSLTTVIVGSDTLQPGEAYTVDLVTGENELIISAISADGNVRGTYTIYITREPEIDVRVDTMYVTVQGDTVPVNPISSDTHFVWNVPRLSQSVSITPIAGDAVKLTVNGDTVASGMPSVIQLAEGDTTTAVMRVISISGENSRVYTLVFVREDDNPPELDTLEVIVDGVNMLENFSRTVTEYTLHFPYRTETVSFVTMTADSMATVMINSDTLRQGEPYPYALDVGDNIVNLDVISSRGDYQRTYIMHLVRADAPVVRLDTLHLSVNGDILPVTAVTQDTNYVWTIPWGNESVSLNSVAGDSVIVTVEGDTLTSNDTKEIQLDQGDTTTVFVRVISRYGYGTRIYRLSLIREQIDPPELDTLEVIVDGVNMLENYSRAVTEYTLNFPYRTETVSFVTMTADSMATVMINSDTLRQGEPYPYALNVGDNIVNLDVISHRNNSQRTYILNLYRDFSTDASLKSLSLLADGNPVALGFDSADTAYEVSLPWYTDSISVIAQSSDSNAILSVGGVSVSSGDTSTFGFSGESISITCNVNATDGQTSSSYVIRGIREEAPRPQLSSLEIIANGANRLTGFTPENSLYMVSVPYGADSVAIFSTAADSAQVMVGGETVISGDSLTLAFADSIDTIEVQTSYPSVQTSHTYEIVVVRGDYVGTDLSGIEVFGTDFVATVTRTDDTLKATVPYVHDSINIRIHPRDPLADVNMSEMLIDSTNRIKLSLAPGSNTFHFDIYGSDEADLKRYKLVIDRIPDSSAQASSIAITGYEDAIAFSPDTFSYSLVLDTADTAIELTVETVGEGATVSIDGGVYEQPGTRILPVAEKDTLRIYIESGDHSRSINYTLSISRPYYRVSINKIGTGYVDYDEEGAIVAAGSTLPVSMSETDSSWQLSSTQIGEGRFREYDLSTTSGGLRIAVTKSETLTVTFKPANNLIVQSETGGSIEPGTPGWLREGDTVGIKAVAESGYFFNGWTVAGNAGVVDPTSDSSGAWLDGGPGSVTANFIESRIVTEPADTLADAGDTVSFFVSTNAVGAETIEYQWQKDGVDIAGATDSVYSTRFVSGADSGAQFRCVVTSPEASETSDPATLHVVSVKKAALGGWHSMVLKTDGSLWGVGDNRHGQIGHPSGDASTTRLVKVMENVRDVAVGDHHTMIIDMNGALWALGNNERGQLGTKNREDTFTPEKVMDGVSAVAPGRFHTMVLDVNGTLYATGVNTNGQLCSNAIDSTDSLVEVMNNIAAVSSGHEHTMVLTDDGRLLGAGNNGNGQLFVNEPSIVKTPVEVMQNVTSVNSGRYHTLVMQNGTFMTAGRNFEGQLGTDPGAIIGIDKFEANGNFSMILIADTLSVTGDNSYGQHGDNSSGNRTAFEAVTIGVSNMACGYFHSMIIRDDGTLWASGINGQGQLGTGSRTNTSHFKLVRF